MQTINFYIILIGALFVGAGAAIKDNQYLYSVMLGLIVALASLLFFAMDRRARSLVQIGEAALREEQARLAIAMDNPALALVDASSASAKHGVSYGRIFYAMFVVIGLLGLAISIGSVSALLFPGSLERLLINH